MIALKCMFAQNLTADLKNFRTSVDTPECLCLNHLGSCGTHEPDRQEA